MIRFSIHFAVWVAILTLAIASAHQVSATTINGGANSRPRRSAVLVELFTSEGCSSCPPADALLGKLDRTQPISSADVIVLSEHVDYWDDAGWKDPYSSRQFSLRQGEYAHRFQLGAPYTPQMVVDGDVQLIGSDERKAIQAIDNATTVPKLPVELSMPHLRDANNLVVRIDVGLAPPQVKLDQTQVWIALADDNDESNVRRGENAGRVLKHVAVVRSLAQVGTIGNDAFSKDVTVNTGNANPQNLRIVAIVQEKLTGRVLGVASTRLPH